MGRNASGHDQRCWPAFAQLIAQRKHLLGIDTGGKPEDGHGPCLCWRDDAFELIICCMFRQVDEGVLRLRHGFGRYQGDRSQPQCGVARNLHAQAQHPRNAGRGTSSAIRGMPYKAAQIDAQRLGIGSERAGDGCKTGRRTVHTLPNEAQFARPTALQLYLQNGPMRQIQRPRNRQTEFERRAIHTGDG